MKTSAWIKLIKEEFGVSRSTANAMYHLMVEYYKAHKEVEND